MLKNKTNTEKDLAVKGNKREPLIVLSKRSSASLKRNILTRIATIALALLFGSIITVLLTKQNPIEVYSSMFNGNFGNEGLARESMLSMCILLCISLAVTPSFKMKFWNIGAEGQTLIGALATAVVIITLGGKIPEELLIITMLAAAMLSGAIWGLLPAFFKAKFGTNETLFTLMMNYVTIQIVEVFLRVADRSGSNTVGPNLLKYGYVPDVFGVKYLSVYIFTALLVTFIFAYLMYMKHGYEITVVGESIKTAEYIGINTKKVIMRTMLLSGALCGAVGFVITGIVNHSIDPNVVGGNGFTAIMVSWLAHFNPFVMIPVSFLITFLTRGASEVSAVCGLNSSYSDILMGIILFFIIGCEFFVNYKISFRSRKRKESDNSGVQKGTTAEVQCEVK